MKAQTFKSWLGESLTPDEEMRLMDLGIHDPGAWYEIEFYVPDPDWEVFRNGIPVKHNIGILWILNPGLGYTDYVTLWTDTLFADRSIPNTIEDFINGRIGVDEYWNRMYSKSSDFANNTTRMLRKHVNYEEDGFELDSIRWIKSRRNNEWELIEK